MGLPLHTARWTPRVLPSRPTHCRRRLLVVDDYQTGAEAITALLAVSGYDAQFVVGGSAVIATVSTWTPEIVLLDINMPDMDGFAVGQLLRQDHRTQHIVMIAFTGLDESTVRANGIATGFDGYCRKGAAPNSLLLLLEELAG